MMAPPSNSGAELQKTEIKRSTLAGMRLASPDPGDEIVISGLSGTYPNSLNVNDFRDNIYNKMDLVAKDNIRWDIRHPEIPIRGGRIYDIEKFDAGFFGVHYKQAHTMDPMGRILLEKTFEAVVDAGLHPSEIRGSRTGVFVGCCFSEAEKTWFYEQLQPHGYAVTGCVRSMLANRISYWLGVDGPSYTVDTACSSSLYAIEHAYRAIRLGQCENAIVGGCNLCLHPYVTLQFARLGVLNKDGNCKCFDESADGYTRAEAVVVVLLQKSKNAKRIYAQIIHAKTNCDGYKEQGITYPSGQIQSKLLKEFYTECGVNPLDVNYVEAHGTGTKVGDPEEVGAIETIFCGKSRKSPLYIGSVKSNIGHTEPASGLCSITKVLLAMESGVLIPNINFKTPRAEMKCISDGRMNVVTEKTKWDVNTGGCMAVSSFGFGGANCHVLLKYNKKEKVNQGMPKDDIPRLLYISGRTEEAINTIIDDVAKRPLDAEYIGLYHEIFKYDIPAHVYRGYAVLTKNKLISRNAEYYPYDDKPLWFVFSGLGSQWLGMGAQLLKIQSFAATIERIHQILSPKGINIIDILTKTDSNIFATQKNVLIAITAIQIALVDMLTSIEVKPVGIIAHSIGNLACAYCDGCLTMEQAILSAYYLGQAVDKCKNITGAMVLVHINNEKVKNIILPGLNIACINSENNCIVSGPKQNIQEFIKKLNEKNIKYDEINSDIAYHSVASKEIASSVLKYLKDLIPSPKEKSSKWICNEKLCSGEFLSTILSNVINFEEMYELVPTNAITLEISAHPLLQNALKKSEFDDSVNIPLMDKKTENSETFITGIGKLYVAGYNPRIERIYPKVQFPVSRGTPMISSLIKWDHTYDWFVTRFEVQDKIKSGERTIPVTINDDEQQYISGHTIDGRILYPATGYLVLVWETVGMVRGQPFYDLPIVFEDVKFHRATNVPKDGRIYLIVMVQKISGNFEVIEGGTAIVTGRVYVPEDIKSEMMDLPIPAPEKKNYYIPLSSRDIYKELKLRGYNYSGLFRGLHSCDTTATVGELYWKNNWVSFMDTILQLQILQEDTRGLFVPTGIQRLSIDVEKHKDIVEKLSGNETVKAYVYRNIKTLVCGGVEIRGLDASAISRKKILGEPVLETYKFIPNILDKTLTLKQSVRVLLHMTLENIKMNKIKTTEVLEDNADETTLLSPIIIDALADLPLKQPEATVLTTKPLEISGITISDKKLVSESNCLIVIGNNILKRNQVLLAALNAIMKNGFIISREPLDINLSEIDTSKISIAADHKLENERLILITRATNKEINNIIDVTDIEQKFEWVPALQEVLKTDLSPVILSQGDDTNGVIGLMNCLNMEPGNENIRCVFIMDKNAPKFDINHELYANQLKKNLIMNIYKNGQWGTYRHLLLDEIKTVDAEHAYVNVTVRGDLSSLRWLQGSLSGNSELDSDRILVHTYYSAMNFRDIMTATGRIAPEVVAKGRFDQDCVQGLEFGGKLSDGRRVIGMINHLAMASMIAADPLLMWDVPDNWTLEEAVTVPVVYGTVLFAFVVEGRIRKGMSVLIHSGSGGVGQAAINVALHYGCTVYTTVGTPEKREFIKRKWPQIKDNQIGNSRDCSFEQMIMLETNGRGVDLVLNSLAEEKLQASIRCLAYGGKFLEIGKFDLTKDNPLPLNTFMKEISFHGVMLDTFFDTASSYKQIISELVKEGMQSGAVKPLERCVFNENEIEEMFRFMSTGKHMGKVLLKIREEEPQKLAKPSKHLIKAIPRYYPSAEGSYVIVGGLGGFGLELVDWLILRGVQKLVITSRKGITTGYQALRIKTWKSYGVDIVISTEDISTIEGCRKIIEQAMDLGPVEAIFNLAVVLNDSVFENQTPEDFAISFRPKAYATKYFDQLSREMCPKLKKFVIFSSVSCGRGNAGQTNYGMANSVMERICEKRHADGLPALAVEWGAVGDVGLVAEMQEDDTELVIGGTLQQKITNCLAVLDQFLQQNEPVVASMLVAEKRAGDGAAGNIVEAVLNILGIRDLKTVSAHSSLAELGMDSIMAVEIKQTLEREFEVFLTPQDIRGMTFTRLHEIAAEREDVKETVQVADGVPDTTEIEVTDMAMYFLLRALGDEARANIPNITMKTNASPSCKEEVILIPGIEGMASVLETLASNLSVNANCLQLGFKTKYTSIKHMAETLYEIAKASRSDVKANFTIAAYSYGAVIALELAALFEAKGAVGNVVFIDGAPKMLKSMVKKRLDSTDDNEIQNMALASILAFILDIETTMYLKTLYEALPTWDEKIEAILQYSTKDIKYSKEHYKNVCNQIYYRIKALVDYEPQVGKLKSKFKLIKPRDITVLMESEDFGLSEYTQQPVDVVYVQGNHVLIVENLETSDEINKTFNEDQIIDKETMVTKVEPIKQESVKI